jgi:predicted RNase H-like HicB family nuclease
MKEFLVIIEKGEDGYYIGTVPELEGCHTQGRNLDELMENIKEAITLCLEIENEDRETLQFIGIQRIAV